MSTLQDFISTIKYEDFYANWSAPGQGYCPLCYIDVPEDLKYQITAELGYLDYFNHENMAIWIEYHIDEDGIQDDKGNDLGLVWGVDGDVWNDVIEVSRDACLLAKNALMSKVDKGEFPYEIVP